MDAEKAIEQLLDRKQDYSPFLVHLTREDDFMTAREILEQILKQQTLRAYKHHCLFNKALDNSNNQDLANRFNVVCFTETPIDQINVLLNPSIERQFKPEPYGLIFTKKYLTAKGGNPVFYVAKEIARPLWQLLNAEGELRTDLSSEVCRLLALVTVCEPGNDWHWEREWRFVGDLQFNLNEIFCGLCPEKEIEHFEALCYPFPVAFISPDWGISKILENLVRHRNKEKPEFPF